ncbi:MAG: TldD/PmbA family protein, partial [Deltaproteobacteria bacterium]
APVAGDDAMALAPPGPARPAPSWALDADTGWLDGEAKARWLTPALEAHDKDGLALAGRFHTGLVTRAVRSTLGVDAFHQGSYADLALSALERPAGHRASAFRSTYTARIDAGEVAAMAEDVRATCHQAHAPRPVPLGAWDVVLMPAAVAELLVWLAEIGFGSRAFEDGTSFLKDRLGEQVTGPGVTLVDDGLMPYGLGVPSPFDAEGQPRQRVPLVEAGVGRGVVYDTRSARRQGYAGTGHASDPAQLSSDGARASHVHFLPGDASVDALVGQLDRGLLISRFHYVNGMLEPRRAVMTGLLRDAAFLVEGGQRRHAVETMRFTDSILEAFARIPAGGVGRDLEAHTTYDEECFVCPPLLIRGLQFTSGR